MLLGTIWRFNWDQVRAYAHSVLSCGYSGPKILFVRDIPTIVIIQLEKLGFQCIPWTLSRADLHPITTRWEPIIRYLGQANYHGPVVITDVNDTVFQSNPFSFLAKHPGKIIGATESILVGHEQTNDGWSDNMRWCVAAVGREEAESVADQEVVCHGTIAGDGTTVLMYVKALYDRLYEHKNPQLIDQGLGQWLLRQEPIAQSLYIPRPAEGYILSGNFCWHSGMDPAPEIRNGVLYPKGSEEPFALVHLTRHSNLRFLTRKYWNPPNPDGIVRSGCYRCGYFESRLGPFGVRCRKCGSPWD